MNWKYAGKHQITNIGIGDIIVDIDKQEIYGKYDDMWLKLDPKTMCVDIVYKDGLPKDKELSYRLKVLQITELREKKLNRINNGL